MSRLWYSMKDMSWDCGLRAVEGPEILLFQYTIASSFRFDSIDDLPRLDLSHNCFFLHNCNGNEWISPNSAAKSTYLRSVSLEENGFFASICDIRFALSAYLKVSWLISRHRGSSQWTTTYSGLSSNSCRSVIIFSWSPISSLLRTWNGDSPTKLPRDRKYRIFYHSSNHIIYKCE